MKLYQIAAATLLLGTSALAWQPKPESAAEISAPVKVNDTKVDTSQQMKKAVNDVLARADAPKLQPAAAVTWDEPGAAAADLDLSETPEAIDAEAEDSGAADTSAEGVGGPVEIAALDLTTRPAAQNYPPCAPGPGDDNCIQLYEPGVRVALASWNQPTGGLLDGQSEVAMGGPYEPVDEGNSETAMNGDGAIDSALGETVEIEAGA